MPAFHNLTSWHVACPSTYSPGTDTMDTLEMTENEVNAASMALLAQEAVPPCAPTANQIKNYQRKNTFFATTLYLDGDGGAKQSSDLPPQGLPEQAPPADESKANESAVIDLDEPPLDDTLLPGPLADPVNDASQPPPGDEELVSPEEPESPGQEVPPVTRELGSMHCMQRLRKMRNQKGVAVGVVEDVGGQP